MHSLGSYSLNYLKNRVLKLVELGADHLTLEGGGG